MEGLEIIEYNGKRYAEVIRSAIRVEKTVFFSHPDSSFQFGLLAHEKDYQEKPHYHKPFTRSINDLQQMFIVQKGVVAVELYSEQKKLIKEIVLHPGDAIVLIQGIHSIRVIEDMQCISVKQGPFLGDENDKVIVEVER
jgi:hypothetical protein